MPSEAERIQQVAAMAADAYAVHDSGTRQQFESGMVREPAWDKPCYTLIPTWFLRRLAVHMTKGAAKYSRDNWRKANSEDELTRMRDSAWRHFVAWSEGQRDEDHMAGAVFNMWAAEETEAKLRGGHGSPIGPAIQSVLDGFGAGSA